MKYMSSNAVPSLPAIQLDLDASAIVLVINIIEQIERLGDPTKLRNSSPKRCRSPSTLESLDESRSMNRSHFERPSHTQDIIPVGDNQMRINPMSCQSVQRAIIGSWVYSPEAHFFHFCQARTELIAQAPK